MSTTCISVRIGVLALQGAFREHIALLRTIPGVYPVEVRTAVELCSVSGLIIPGGESTTIASVAQRWGLLGPLTNFVRSGRPIWGTCAGLILLAEKADGDPCNISSLRSIDCQRRSKARGTGIDRWSRCHRCSKLLWRSGRPPLRHSLWAMALAGGEL